MTAATITAAAELDALGLPVASVVRLDSGLLASRITARAGARESAWAIEGYPLTPQMIREPDFPLTLLYRPDVPHPTEAEVRERVAAEIEAEASARSYDSDEAVTEALLSAARIARGEQR